MNTSNIKYTIKTFVLILIITYIVDKIVFYSLNKISDNVYTGQSIGKLNHFLKIKDNVDLMVFGSSRANHNINPIKLSENSFNIGVDGSKLAYNATLIKLLPKHKKQVILLHIDPEYAFDQKYSGADIQALVTKYNRIKSIKNEIDKLKQGNAIQNFYWSLSYNGSVLGIVKNYLKPNYNYNTYFGFDPIYVTEIQREIFKNVLKKEESENCQEKFTLNTLYDSYIDELKIFCKENNKTIIIFTAPKFKDNCKYDNLQFTQIMKNKEMTYYDLTDYFKDNNSIEYWKDETHLSDIGAEIFTEKIRLLLNEN